MRGTTVRGFTLMELMIVITVTAIILAVGAPSFSEFRRNNRLTAAGNDFLVAVQLARTEAIKRQRRVSLCASPNPASAAPGCGGTDFGGWLVFEDANGDCVRAGGETLLRVDGPLDELVSSDADRGCLTFGATGFTQNAGGNPPASRVLFCDDRGTAAQAGTTQSAARGITISRTGRAAITRDMAIINGWGLACP